MQRPEVYRWEEFGRRMALNVATCGCAFLDEVGDAILDLEGLVRTRREMFEALAHRFPKRSIAAALSHLARSRVLSQATAPLATDVYGASKAITLTLNVAQSCNLRCRYCYIDERALSSNWRMPAPVARRAIDFILERHRGAEKLGISFYGGEPLLNFETVRDAILYANWRATELEMPPVEYHLSTNGTCLTAEMVDFLAAQNINVLVSLDGPPDIHDAMRVDAGGRPTHARVLRAVESLLAARGSLGVSASAVVTPQTRLWDAYRYLRDMGFEDLKVSYVRYRNEDYFALNTRLKEQYIADLREIALDCLAHLLRGQRPAYYEFNRRLLHLWTKTRRIDFCPAGQSRYGISPSGEVYPCGPAACMGHGCLGSLDRGLDTRAVEAFLGQNDIFADQNCRECWGRFLCGGGCPLPIVRGPAHNCDITLEITRLSVYIYLAVCESNEFLLSTLVDEKLPAYVTAIVNSAMDDPEGEPCEPQLRT